MKIFKRSLFLCFALMLAAWTQIHAQCTQGVLYGTGTALATCATAQPTLTCHFINEYAKFTGLTIGNTYQIGTNMPGTPATTVTAGAHILTLYDGTGAVLTFQVNATNNLTNLTFVATTTEVRVQTNTYTGSVCGTTGSYCHYYGLLCTSCVGGPGAPTCPTLSSPAANAVGVSTAPTLTWASSTGASSYDVYLSADATCTGTPAFVANVTTTSYTVPGPLAQMTQYRWMVIPKDCAGAAPASCIANARCFVTAGPPPANDDCVGAIAFPTIPTDGTCATVTANTAGATGALDATCGGAEDDDVWYTFTVPAGYTSVLYANTNITGSTDRLIQILSGSCPGVSVGCYDPESGTITGLTGGTTYFLRVFTYAAAAVSNFSICLSVPPPPPANDLCAGAIAFPTLPNDGTCATVTVNTAGATGTLDATCGGAEDDDVWYTFTVPVGFTSVLYTNTNISGSTDRNLQILSGACPGTSVGCFDPESGTISGLTGGTTYLLRANSYGTGVSTNFTLCLRVPPAVPNCATLNTPANGATGVAINTPLTWTAPVGGGTPTGYKVYLGTVNPPTTLVSTVTAPTTTYNPTGQAYSTTYYWYVVPTNGGGDAVGCNGTIFSYTTGVAPPAPANDLCGGATSITSGPGIFVSPGTQTTESATATGAPGTGGSCTTVSITDYDVWYSFTTDADGGDITINVIPTTPQDIIVQGFTTAGSCSGTSVCADLQVTGGPLTNGGETLTMTALSLHGSGSADNTATYFFRVYHYTNTATAPSPFQFTINASGTALPIELKSFTGQIQATTNVLSWETLTEKNVQSHVVERSIDGSRWTEVGRVAGKTNSQVSVKYTLEDRAPLSKAYYRLRSVDFDGKENLSNTIVLNRKSESFGITSVYPSPTSSNVTVQFNSTEEEKVTVRVMDMTGRLVMQQITEAVKDINELPLTLTGLQAGVYTVTVSNSTGVSTPVRFVKQ